MKKFILTIISLAAFITHVNGQSMIVKQNVVNLGQVIYQLPQTAEYELQNVSNAMLYIRNIKTSCGCTTVDYPTNGIPSGEKIKIKAQYDAKQMGHFEKLIAVYLNTDEPPITLKLKGVVVSEVHVFTGNYVYDLGAMSVDKRDIEFDDVTIGDRPFQEIHIKNNSNQLISPVVMHLPSYLKVEMSPSTIAPGKQGVARLTLESEQVKSFGLTQTTLFLASDIGEEIDNDKEISLSVVLLPNFDNLTASQKINAPHIELSEEEITLELNNKKKQAALITIKNSGKSTLDINSLQMFTTGLKVSLTNTHLAPNEEAKMKVTIDKKHLKTVRSQPRILMITNDPNKPKTVIKINIK